MLGACRSPQDCQRTRQRYRSCRLPAGTKPLQSPDFGCGDLGARAVIYEYCHRLPGLGGYDVVGCGQGLVQCGEIDLDLRQVSRIRPRDRAFSRSNASLVQLPQHGFRADPAQRGDRLQGQYAFHVARNGPGE